MTAAGDSPGPPASSPPPPPPLPRLAWSAIADLRERIVVQSMPFYEEAPEGRRFDAWVDVVHRAVGGARRVPRDAVAGSCECLLGEPLTLAALEAWAWRLAGNLDRLRAGQAVTPWTGQAACEWYPLVIRTALRGLDRRGRPGAEFTACAVAGSYCPGTLRFFWRREIASLVAGKLGFTPPWGTRPLRHLNQLVGLRLFGLVEPRLTRDGRPGFHTVAASTTMVAANRRILARRFREQGTRCPFGLDGPKHVECHLCTIGYQGVDGQDACRAACHPLAYTFAACPSCGADPAPFDAVASATVCLTCALQERLRPSR